MWEVEAYPPPLGQYNNTEYRSTGDLTDS